MTTPGFDYEYDELPDETQTWRNCRPNILSNGNDYRWVYRPHEKFAYKTDEHFQDAHPAFTWLGGHGPVAA